jgi:hypothetical protein
MRYIFQARTEPAVRTPVAADCAHVHLIERAIEA